MSNTGKPSASEIAVSIALIYDALIDEQGFRLDHALELTKAYIKSGRELPRT